MGQFRLYSMHLERCIPHPPRLAIFVAWCTHAYFMTTRFSQYQLKQPTENQPWARPASEQKLPTQLVKRSIPSTKEDENEEIEHAPTSTVAKYNTPILDSLSSIDNFDQMPPKKSINDFTEDSFGGHVTQREREKFTHFDAISENPTDFKSFFNSKKQEDLKNEKSINQESAVIVMGYNDSRFDLVLEHFAKFGHILEDFNVVSHTKPLSKAGAKKVPIFVGYQWVKITYDNPNGAIRAVRENGCKLDLDEKPVKVILYTKTALEQLLKTSIKDQDDIGDLSRHGLSTQNINSLNNESNFDLSHVEVVAVQQDLDIGAVSSRPGVLRFKDGKNLFLKSQKKVEENEKEAPKGFVARISQYIFGFNEV